MRIAWLVVAIVLPACGGEQTSSPGPIVSVLRQTSGTCFELMASTQPAAGLGPMVCAGPATNTQMLAGIDLVELVIDYGTIEFPEAATIPAPTITVLADGKSTTVSASVALQQRVQSHTFFLASFRAPALLSNDVQISVSVTPGYATDVPTIYQVVQPSATLSVLAKTPAGCLALAGGVAPATDLGLPNLCDPQTTVAVHAAVDPLELVIDYGTPTVPDIAPTTSIPAPSATVIADGTAQPALTVGTEQHTATNRRFFTAHLHAPSTPSNDLLFEVRTVANAIPAQVRLATIAAVPDVAIVECGASCAATAGVGFVHAVVTLAGDVPQTVAIHALIDHVHVADPVSAITTSVVDAHTEATVAIPVPTGVADGTIWTIEAQIGATVKPIDIILHQPTITASTSCSAPCTKTVGTSLGFTVVAPLDIRDRHAIYTTTLDGVPQVAQGTLDLVTPDNIAKTIAGTVALSAPSQPGTWNIDASVSGYHAQTITIRVVP